MLKKLFITILFAFFSYFIVNAQENVSFSFVNIELWPEYDRRDMLVINHFALSQETSLPANIIFRIPASTGGHHAVAASQPDGSLIYIPSYDQKVEGDWIVLNFTTTSPEFRIEFYDPNLILDGDLRSYQYNWPGDHQVSNMSVNVKQPIGSSDLSIAPAASKNQIGQDGLKVYNVDVGSLSEGQMFTISVNYLKQTDNLSIDNLQVQPSGNIELPVAANINVSSSSPLNTIWLPAGLIILGVLGVGLLIGGGYLYWQSSSESRKSQRTRSRHKSATQKNQQEPAHSYCQKCGKRAQTGDRFCRVCGTKLRSQS